MSASGSDGIQFSYTRIVHTNEIFKILEPRKYFFTNILIARNGSEKTHRRSIVRSFVSMIDSLTAKGVYLRCLRVVDTHQSRIYTLSRVHTCTRKAYIRPLNFSRCNTFTVSLNWYWIYCYVSRSNRLNNFRANIASMVPAWCVPWSKG